MTTRRDGPDVHRVNVLLHTLRGEAFRRQRNIKGSSAFAPPTSSPRGPSLPPLVTSGMDPDDNVRGPHTTSSASIVTVAGPSPPRSWLPSEPYSNSFAIPEWRARALSLIIKHSPALAVPINARVPSLFQLCLHNLLHDWGGIPPELFTTLPRHILREYVRYSVVHAPDLPRTDLEALWSVDDAGSADGEIIISGSFAASILPRLSVSYPTVSSEWDAPSDAANPEPPPTPHTLILLAPGVISLTMLSAFPPTLTRLALLNVSSVALHKLPRQLPLIEALDLSFNYWIGRSMAWIIRVEWSRWTHLEVLGLRECGLSVQDCKVVEEKVNRRRFKDVDIVW